MEKYKLLLLFILCNCITLSVQIFGMEKEKEEEEKKESILSMKVPPKVADYIILVRSTNVGGPFELKEIDAGSKKICTLRGIGRFNKLRVSNGLVLNVTSIRSDQEVYLYSECSLMRLKEDLKISKRGDVLEIEQNNNNNSPRITFTLGIPCGWNNKTFELIGSYMRGILKMDKVEIIAKKKSRIGWNKINKMLVLSDKNFTATLNKSVLGMFCPFRNFKLSLDASVFKGACSLTRNNRIIHISADHKSQARLTWHLNKKPIQGTTEITVESLNGSHVKFCGVKWCHNNFIIKKCCCDETSTLEIDPDSDELA